MGGSQCGALLGLDESSSVHPLMMLPNVAPRNIPEFCIDCMQAAGGVGEQSIPALLNYTTACSMTVSLTQASLSTESVHVH